MAIAYFIPDQAKLLAGQRSSRANNNSSSRSSAANNQPAARAQQNSSANETAPVDTTVNRGYGTTINISVPTMNNTTQEPLGCWDFLTQVFCHALRFYHESSQLQPTVIQISVNFNTQPNTPTTTTATTTSATTATTSTETAPTTATTTPNSQEVPLSEPTTPANTATATAAPKNQKQRKFSKRKN